MTATESQGGVAAPALPRLPARLHHHAFVVKDQEATRRFYEDVLGIPLAATWCEKAELFGKERTYCHTFYEIADGSALAFFQFADPADVAEFGLAKPPSPFDHFAMKVDQETQEAMIARVEANGLQHMTIDHGYCVSFYTWDPDGLMIEFTVDPPDAGEIAAMRRKDAHSELARWLAGDHTPNNDIRDH
ncbi:MAG: VOC family protein [Acidimicrobiales bacterium]